MKRILVLALAMLMLLSLAGCDRSGAEVSSTVTDPTVVIPTPDNRDPTGGGQRNPNELTLGETGKIRGRYTINVSSVRYVTSVEQLPNYEGLEQFDEAYFQEKALLVVIETVTSGSIGVEIESVTIEGENAVVKLAHKPGAQIGTTDMTVWLLWAEVDKDLTYRWSVANPAVESDTSEY